MYIIYSCRGRILKSYLKKIFISVYLFIFYSVYENQCRPKYNFYVEMTLVIKSNFEKLLSSIYSCAFTKVNIDQQFFFLKLKFKHTSLCGREMQIYPQCLVQGVGAYSSLHLLCYTEKGRIRINVRGTPQKGMPVEKDSVVTTFLHYRKNPPPRFNKKKKYKTLSQIWALKRIILFLNLFRGHKSRVDLYTVFPWFIKGFKTFFDRIHQVELVPLCKMGISDGLRLKLDQQTISSAFDSHWVLHASGFVSQLSKS